FRTRQRQPHRRPGRLMSAASAAGGLRRGRRRDNVVAYAMVAPALAAFAVFVFYPLVKTFYLGFFSSPPFPTLPSHYVGVSQYRTVLTSSSFLASLWRTVLFVAFTVPAGIAIGLGLAALAHQKLAGVRIFRTIYASTVATSTAVASAIFFTLLNPQVGLLSYWLGIKGGSGVLQDPTWALPMVSLVTVWQTIGFTFILMSAALQSVPDELLEAARVDGASGWSRFRRVTLPLLSPTIFFAVVVGIIASFQAFAQIDVLTQGGPNGHTTVLIYALYQAFRTNDNGTAAVLSVALFVILLVLTLVQFRFVERRVFYG
ncbi:MAG TPA: sugar ABC transporter permease, partial [Mycobacterium sp.]|nr:sugar ABC transporter permease [Mycobacterium sp.]